MSIEVVRKHIEKKNKGNRVYFDIMTELDLMAMVLKNDFTVEIQCTHVEEIKLKSVFEYKTSTSYVVFDLDREIKKICKRIIEATFNESKSDALGKVYKSRVKKLHLLDREDQDEYHELEEAVRNKITGIFEEGNNKANSIASEAKANCTPEDLQTTLFMLVQNEYGANNNYSDLYNALFSSSPDKIAEIYNIYLDSVKKAESFYNDFGDYTKTLIAKIKKIEQQKDEEKAIEDFVNQRNLGTLSSRLKNFLDWP